MIDYLDWQSALSLEQVFAGNESFSHPSFLAGPSSAQGLVYLTSLKAEKSRSALMLKKELDLNTDASCITPAPFSLQTKVNEYGGKPYWLFGELLVFANQADQCLYWQNLNDDDSLRKPQRLTIEPSEEQRFMYTDVQHVGDQSYLAIVELVQSELVASELGAKENTMFIGVIGGDHNAAPVAVQHGADFYSNLVVNSSQDRVAWIQWQHPSMPWDENELWTAELVCKGGEVSLENAKQIDLNGAISRKGKSGACVCQLIFANNDELFFSADFQNDSENTKDVDNYWNIYCYQTEREKISQVTEQSIEFGYPHWVYGDSRIVRFDQEHLLAVGSSPEGDALFLINQTSHQVTLLTDQMESSRTLQHLASDGAGQCLAIELKFDANPNLLNVKLGEGQLRQDFIIRGQQVDIDISAAQHISFPTRDQKNAFGFYYPPSNSSYQSRTRSERPPLIVMVHGGPTARAYGHFDLQKQFWTSRGFAILDVNHRGSSGYGRQYRDALYGQWGELDASDIVDGVQHLIEQGKADAERICIRGKSAGGYAVLRALTEYPRVFKVGACYYGIGNLVTLAETTHKFEKYYTDRLVNERFDPHAATLASSKFYQRSPINKIDKVGSAMIIFQGLQDKVVPPSVAKEMVKALKAAKLDYEYVEYADEAHGFRQVVNNIDAWGKELQFYQRVLAQQA